MLKGTLGKVSGLSANLSTAFVEGKAKVLQFSSIYDLPNRGNSESLYMVGEENACYRWDEDNSKYFCVGRDYNEIEIIICGGNA